MKYLYIHKLIWFLLVTSWTLLEAIIISIYYILYALWNLKSPKNIWSEIHSYSDYIINYGYSPPQITTEIKSDKNIFKTIKRRYKICG